MEELLDELTQGIEMRVDQLGREWSVRNEAQSPEDGQKQQKETSDRLNQIIMGLPEADGDFLDGLLIDRQTAADEERMWFYKSGMADALDILRYLRR